MNQWEITYRLKRVMVERKYASEFHISHAMKQALLLAPAGVGRQYDSIEVRMIEPGEKA